MKKMLIQDVLVCGFLLSLLVACGGGGGGGSNSQGTIGTPDPITVVPDASASSSALVNATGGEVSATGANSAIYTLSVPPESLLDSESVTVTLTPVSTVENLPSSEENLAAVQFSPDGLTFGKSVSLAVKLPNVYDATNLLAYTFEGNGQNMAFIPIENYDPGSSTVTLSLYHFSGAGITLGDRMDLIVHPADPSSESYYRQQIAILEYQAAKEGKIAYSSPKYLEKISNVYTDWFKFVLSGSVKDISNYDLKWTKELVKKYSMWLGDVGATQCKTESGCGTVTPCFADSGLSPQLDDIREYAAGKFAAHFKTKIDALSQQCVAASKKCDKKALIEEGLGWKELSQLGGVTEDSCRGNGETVHFGGYFCEDAYHSIVGSVVFAEAPAAALQKGGQAIYQIKAYDMFGEEIAYPDAAFSEVWPGLDVKWSTDNPQILQTIDVTNQCVQPNCTRLVLAAALNTGTANLIGTVSGDEVCGTPIEARMVLNISPDTTPPNILDNGSFRIINVDADTSVLIGVSANDGEYYNYGFPLSSGTGIDHAEFYKDNNGSPGELIGVSPCSASECDFVYQIPACYGLSSMEYLIFNYGAMVVDRAGNRSKYAEAGSFNFYATQPGPCYP